MVAVAVVVVVVVGVAVVVVVVVAVGVAVVVGVAVAMNAALLRAGHDASWSGSRTERRTTMTVRFIKRREADGNETERVLVGTRSECTALVEALMGALRLSQGAGPDAVVEVDIILDDLMQFSARVTP